jgi:hypothetical protein
MTIAVLSVTGVVTPVITGLRAGLVDRLTVAARLIALTSADAFQVAHVKQLKQYMFRQDEFQLAVRTSRLTELLATDSLTGLAKGYHHY